MITAPNVRLIGEKKEPLGIVTIAEALRMAEEAELDLVEISPLADPPVCRIMDIGKFKYAESKKQHEAKLKQKQVQIKEIKFRPNTDEGDYNIKLRNLIKFLGEGDKTKVTLRFRGREMAHQEIGMRLIERVRADLEDYGVVEQFPKMEGRQMVMVLSPKPKKKEKEVKDTKDTKAVKEPKAKVVKEPKAKVVKEPKAKVAKEA
jgi:translation initiation factor IF-3